MEEVVKWTLQEGKRDVCRLRGVGDNTGVLEDIRYICRTKSCIIRYIVGGQN